jgi:hypothetical protein
LYQWMSNFLFHFVIDPIIVKYGWGYSSKAFFCCSLTLKGKNK